MTMPRTTGVVVVTHGVAGAAMIEVAERLTGFLPRVEAVTVVPGEPPDALEERLSAAVASLGGGGEGGVLFLVDLGGSTPANLCERAGGPSQVAVLTGLNLPMLLKLATADRAGGVRALADELCRTGVKSIAVRFPEPDA